MDGAGGRHSATSSRRSSAACRPRESSSSLELLSDASLRADPIFDSVRIGLLRMAQRRRKLRGLSKASQSSGVAK